MKSGYFLLNRISQTPDDTFFESMASPSSFANCGIAVVVAGGFAGDDEFIGKLQGLCVLLYHEKAVWADFASNIDVLCSHCSTLRNSCRFKESDAPAGDPHCEDNRAYAHTDDKAERLDVSF